MAIRFDLAGWVPLEITLSKDVVAGLFLELRDASALGRWLCLHALVARYAPVGAWQSMIEGGLRDLVPALYQLCADVVAGFPIDAHGVTYTGLRRASGRCVGLGHRHAWVPRVIRGAPVIPGGGA